jgi:uncharacterized protein YndB with AHSA1/START domain
MSIEPIRRTITVACSPEHAFRVFTEETRSWWPVERFSIAAESGADVQRIVMEPRSGGRLFEVQDDGTEAPWGQVMEWQPPARLVLAWKPNTTPHPPTEVEVRFTSAGRGTLVELEHRGWERLGADAAEAHEGYAEGWPLVFDELFAAAAGVAVARSSGGDRSTTRLH